jgi:hypothetical protein
LAGTVRRMRPPGCELALDAGERGAVLLDMLEHVERAMR